MSRHIWEQAHVHRLIIPFSGMHVTALCSKVVTECPSYSSTVMLDEHNVARLDCCGLAAAAAWEGQLEQLPPSARQVGMGWNASVYMAPEIHEEAAKAATEQAKKQKKRKPKKGCVAPSVLALPRAAAPAADVYAFGVLVWEIFAGQVWHCVCQMRCRTMSTRMLVDMH